MTLLNPALAWFLPGLLLPLLLHLLWRRRVRLLLWGAMGPLRDLQRDHAKRLVFERWGLLVVRTILLAALLLALCRPVWLPEHPAGDRRAAGRTAAIMLIDDSASSRRGSSRPAWEGMQALARTYIDGLQPGDEISVLLASRLDSEAPDPRFDHERVAAWIDGLQPSDAASDHQAMLSRALAQVERHINPAIEIVVVTDDADDGWPSAEHAADQALAALRVEHQGLRVLVLRAAANPSDEGQHAVQRIEVANDLVTVGDQLRITAHLQHWGEMALPQTLRLQLLIDDQPVEERSLQVEQPGVQELPFTYAFDQSGSHAVGVRIVNAVDGDSADDVAYRAVTVVDGIAVLLVEGRQGASRFAAAALEASIAGRRAFTVDRCHFSELTDAALADRRVVVLLDVPALQADQVAAIEQFVVAGGGVLAVLGPDSDPALINRFWVRGGDGFMPTALIGEQGGAGLQAVRSAQRGHPLFSDLPDDASWSLQTRRWMALEPPALVDDQQQVLLRLDNGTPFLITRRRGAGRTAIWAAPLDRRWGDAVLAPVFVPLLRGLVHTLGSSLQPASTVMPGERLLVIGGERPVLVGPHGSGLPMEQSRWRGQAAWRSPPIAAAGIYHCGDARLVCTPQPRERAAGDPLAGTAWAERNRATVLGDQAAVRAMFADEAQRPREWWPLLAAIGLLAGLVEVFWLWVMDRRERRLAA